MVIYEQPNNLAIEGKLRSKAYKQKQKRKQTKKTQPWAFAHDKISRGSMESNMKKKIRLTQDSHYYDARLRTMYTCLIGASFIFDA